jgi:hypothetical protein
METFLGVIVILAWFAVVIWGATSLVIRARRTKDWEKVGTAALSGARSQGVGFGNGTNWLAVCAASVMSVPPWPSAAVTKLVAM